MQKMPKMRSVGGENVAVAQFRWYGLGERCCDCRCLGREVCRG